MSLKHRFIITSTMYCLLYFFKKSIIVNFMQVMLFFWNASYTVPRTHMKHKRKPFFDLFPRIGNYATKYRVRGLYINHHENAQLFKTFLNKIASVLVPGDVAHPLYRGHIKFRGTTTACTIVLHMFHLFSR